MALIDEKGRLFGKVNLVDVLVILFLLCLAPGGYYVYKSITTWNPLIVSVDPPKIDAEVGGTLTIYGKNFRSNSQVKLGNTLLRNPIYHPSDRLEVWVPPQKELGRYPISVTNPTGQIAILKNVVLLVAKPRITHVSPTRFKTRQGAAISISGKNFDSFSTVMLGGLKLKNIEFVSTEQLLARVSPGEVRPGICDISITNNYGFTASHPEVIDAEGCYVITVFATLSLSDALKLKTVRDGPDQWDGNEIRILSILKKEDSSNKEVTVVANILLPGQDVKLIDVGRGIKYFLKGEPVGFDSQLLLQVKGVKMDARVVSTPAPLYNYDPDASYRYD